MAVAMQKVPAIWTGFTGAPGYTNFWLQGTSVIPPTTFKAFFDSFAAYIPATVTITVQNSGELVNPDDGKVVGTWSSGSPAVSTGTAVGGVLLTAEGPQLRLETGAFRRGKHIRGRIFLIPANSAVLASGGTVAPAAVTALNTAAETLRTATGGQWGVFHRPLYDRTVKPPVLKTIGEFIAIPANGATVQNKAAVLTTRRD